MECPFRGRVISSGRVQWKVPESDARSACCLRRDMKVIEITHVTSISVSIYIFSIIRLSLLARLRWVHISLQDL